ncbi:Fcf2 pre-rRNA processing protein [Zea mays]|jgi:hypothetical protein|uniref:Fcf2 pre-rRNA processing protein n=1 Tax=Zea mays TaxID=4577 RepID=A0A1D6GLT1_MAIZE|nr:Fcf2 pre-rRNA processing protein [Zea mays]AQK64267.1 Fcf2 pre-rRNA processing protein [Zea mays]
MEFWIPIYRNSFAVAYAFQFQFGVTKRIQLQVCLFSYIGGETVCARSNILNFVAALFTLYRFAMVKSLLTIGLVNFMFRVMCHA